MLFVMIDNKYEILYMHYENPTKIVITFTSLIYKVKKKS